jgi:hypothetical protein
MGGVHDCILFVLQLAAENVSTRHVLLFVILVSMCVELAQKV